MAQSLLDITGLRLTFSLGLQDFLRGFGVSKGCGGFKNLEFPGLRTEC